MSRRGTLIFYASAYVSVRQRLCPPASMPACVSASLRLRPPVPLPVCVLASLCFRPPVPLPVCVPASLHPQHCSASSLISPIFIQLIRFFLFFSLVLFFPFFPYLIFSFLFFLFFSSSLLLFFSDIFSSYSLDPSCSSRDTPFSVKNLYREHTLRNCDVPHAATHPFELKTLYREQIPGH